MSATTTFKHWMHHIHDGGARAAHYSGHLLHERAFWIILTFVLLMTGLFTLVVLYGQASIIRDYYRVPLSPMMH